MRRDLVTVAGTNFFDETPVLVAVRDRPLISFRHDDRGYMLLSLETPDAAGNPRVSLKTTTGSSRATPRT
jgi:hypothetical protein